MWEWKFKSSIKRSITISILHKKREIESSPLMILQSGQEIL
jgi:hypothetical protein